MKRDTRRNWLVTKRLVFFWAALSLLFFAPVPAGEDGTQGKTWKTILELSATEQAQIDLHTDTPRDPRVPYLPAEQFPFSPPYTAEEMGLRSMEFAHTPFWNLTLIDIYFTRAGIALFPSAENAKSARN